MLSITFQFHTMKLNDIGLTLQTKFYMCYWVHFRFVGMSKLVSLKFGFDKISYNY